MNKINEFLKGGTSFASLFNDLGSEKYQEYLWRTVAYGHDWYFSREQLEEIVRTGIDFRNNYSASSMFIIDSGYGLRFRLIQYLIDIMDQLNYRYPFTNEKSHNVLAALVFGKEGIAKKLAGRNIISFFELFEFRLHCCFNRVSKPRMYHLFDAIGEYENPGFKSEGEVNQIAIQQMRILSQKCFGAFKSKYIDPQINFVREIEQLQYSDLEGNFPESNTNLSSMDIERFKREIVGFISYQIGNKIVDDTGVGCGYYDVEGKNDLGGIQKTFTDYLLDVVFSEEYYLQKFLLISLRNGSGFDRSVAKAEGLFKIVDKEMFLHWWLKNNTRIKNEECVDEFQFDDINETVLSSEIIKRIYNEFDQEARNYKH